MTPLEQLRADQHNDARYPSDHALTAYLAETAISTARLDLAPHNTAEILHLARNRNHT